MSGQKRKLIRMLAFIMKSLDWHEAEWREEIDPMDDLMLVVLAMGRRHSQLYRIPRESYAVVPESIVSTPEQAETQGEAALITQLSAAGIDEARLGLAELS